MDVERRRGQWIYHAVDEQHSVTRGQDPLLDPLHECSMEFFIALQTLHVAQQLFLMDLNLDQRIAQQVEQVRLLGVDQQFCDA